VTRILEDASLVVATRDRPELLRDLLASVARLDPAPGELIVVDDSSAEPIGPIVRAWTLPIRVRVLRNERAVGPGAARNRGVHRSRGEFLLFTDDDCVLDVAWAGALVDALRAGDPQLGGVGGRVLARDKDLFSRYYEFHRILEPRPHDAAHRARIPYLITANCAVRRVAFMSAGGFDGRIPAAGGEDAALSMRMAKRGFFFERTENATVRHRFRASVMDFARTFYRYGLGGRYVVDRYLPL
jgi:glycosyltransferase involved in cell wall biosynthesis